MDRSHFPAVYARATLTTAPAAFLRPEVSLRALSLLPALVLAAPVPALSQGAHGDPPSECAWEARPADRSVSELLYETGQRLAAERAWRQAAEAVEASAMLHPPCLEAVERFREAARLFHYGEHLERARLAMIDAAERAVDLKELALAAHAYLDAAELAQLMDDPGAAVLPIAAALELARSPDIPRSARETIRRRLGRAAPAATAADAAGATGRRGS